MQKLRTDPSAPIRGLYVNRFAAQSTKRMRKLIEIADSTEINAFVIDVKDEFGLNFKTSNADASEERGDADEGREHDGAARHAATRTRFSRSRASWCSRIR